jgi:hypothetical protein
MDAAYVPGFNLRSFIIGDARQLDQAWIPVQIGSQYNVWVSLQVSLRWGPCLDKYVETFGLHTRGELPSCSCNGLSCTVEPSVP